MDYLGYLPALAALILLAFAKELWIFWVMFKLQGKSKKLVFSPKSSLFSELKVKEVSNDRIT